MNLRRSGYFIVLISLVLSPLIFLVNSCKHSGVPADQLPQICFTEQVLPIFQNSCSTSGCHDGQRGESRYVFTDYANIMKAITPGNAEKSKAYRAMIDAFQVMPPNNPLPESKRTLIRLWIEQGAKETTCSSTTAGSPPDSTLVSKSGTSWACYDRDIQPILMSSCAVSGCHDATTHREGIDFSSYQKTLQRIKAGDPAHSSLYNSITGNSEDIMPPKPYSRLSKAAVDSIYSWIKRGGLNEQCASACDTTGTIAYASHIKSIIDLSCVSCHGSTNPSGGIDLTSKSGLQAVAQAGKLIPAITRTGKFPMPPTYALSDCEVRQVELWMNQGYN